MEKQNVERIEIEDEQLEYLIEQIQKNKDEQAMLAFLELFEEDIQYLAKYMRITREDAVQSLKLSMLQLLLDR